jgi:hypothetical protein
MGQCCEPLLNHRIWFVHHRTYIEISPSKVENVSIHLEFSYSQIRNQKIYNVSDQEVTISFYNY